MTEENIKRAKLTKLAGDTFQITLNLKSTIPATSMNKNAYKHFCAQIENSNYGCSQVHKV